MYRTIKQTKLVSQIGKFDFFHPLNESIDKLSHLIRIYNV